MRGILKTNKDSKIYAEGRTYDGTLYTFRESNYRDIWHALDIIVKKLDKKNNWKNIFQNITKIKVSNKKI
jgi:hypothetical protein